MSVFKVDSISQLHSFLGLSTPKHPLISLIDASNVRVTEQEVGSKAICDFYMVSLKDKSCGVEYGRYCSDSANQ